MNDDITFACVVWNDAHRLKKLLEWVRPFFDTMVVGVQESKDDTLAVAREWADIVVTDEHRGFGDATFGPKILPEVRTTWTFKVDADEWPSEMLMVRLTELTWKAGTAGTKGVWIPFRSSVEGVEYDEQHTHLRLFHTSEGWPAKLHSRPPIEDGITATWGHIRHDRSLDEMMLDYLNYYRIGKGDEGWEKHNREMMWYATTGTAAKLGWPYVKKYGWWPDVQRIAFDGADPES